MGACPYFSAPLRDERGVALLIALAILVLMAILAVSFYTSEEIEQHGTEAARFARSAESIAQGGLEWAIALIESDIPDAGGSLLYDTNYDIWGLHAWDTFSAPPNDMSDVLLAYSDPNDNDKNLCDLDDYDPDDPTHADNDYLDARWHVVHDGDRIIGRWAAIVTCENAKANVNVVGNVDDVQAEGVSPAEVSLQAILTAIEAMQPSLPDDITDWVPKIMNRRQGNEPGDVGDDSPSLDGIGFVKCDDNLNGAVDEANDAVEEPAEHDLNNIKGDDIKFLDLSTVLMDVDFASAGERRMVLNAIRDYITLDSLTQLRTRFVIGGTVFWSEQLPLNLYAQSTGGQTSIWVTMQQLLDEGRLPAGFDLWQLGVNIKDFLDEDSDPSTIDGPGSTRYGIEKNTAYINEIETDPEPYTINDWRGQYTATVSDHGEFIELINPYDVPAEVRVTAYWQRSDGAAVKFTSGVLTVPARSGNTAGYLVLRDRSGVVRYVDSDDVPRKEYVVFPLGNERPADIGEAVAFPANLRLEGDPITLIRVQNNHVIETTGGGIGSAVGPETAQKDDPRQLGGWIEAPGTPGDWNDPSACNPGATGDMDSNARLSDLFAIYDGPVGSVGHLGLVYTGQPWTTIDMTGDGVTWDTVHEEPCWLNLYDTFTASLFYHECFGLININTAPKEILMGLKGVDETLAQRIVDYVTLDQRFESVGELGQFIIPGPSATLNSWDREKALADVAGLITVRSQNFRVTVLAEAVDRQGNSVAQRKLEATVRRTFNLLGEPTVNVLSTRWLSEY